MKEHHVDGTSSVEMLRGQIRYSAEGQTYDLEATSLLAVGASIQYEVKAIEAFCIPADDLLASQSTTACYAASRV